MFEPPGYEVATRHLARDERFPGWARAATTRSVPGGRSASPTSSPTSELEDALLDRLGAGLDEASFGDEFATDWVCLDAEPMPWSVGALRHCLPPVLLAGGLG